MPAQKPGSSKQDFGTPREFIAAVEKQFGKLHTDLAATKENEVCSHFFTEQDDSLSDSVDWVGRGLLAAKQNQLLWLNPPFGEIKRWAEKASQFVNDLRGLHRDRRSWANVAELLMLVPASIGTNWFAEFVEPYASIYALRPRLVFVGHKDPFPKDLMLCLYGAQHGDHEDRNFKCWKWNA